MPTSPRPEADAERALGLGHRSLLERAFGVITEVRAGEGVTALIMTLNVFLLLTAYYVIKPVRKGLILAVPNGAEYESYLGGAIAFSLLFAVPAYASVASRVPKNKLVVGVTLFFASHLAIFYGLSLIPGAKQYLGLVFFVWVGIFNMMVVAQFWAFANDLYTQDQGKRLFAILGLGQSLGAVAGAKLTPLLKKSLGTYQLLFVCAAILVVCALLTRVAHSRERARVLAIAPAAKPHAIAAPRAKGAFALVFEHKYLTLIAVFSLVFTFVNTNGEYMLSALVTGRAVEAATAKGITAEPAVLAFIEDYSTVFFADFFVWVNVIGVAIQMFAVSRIVRFAGLRVAFFVFPVIALFDSFAMIFLPALLAVRQLTILRPGKIAENATDYSLNNTVRNMLWLPTTTEMKYAAKQAVDTFFVRMGDVASALLVALGHRFLDWPIRSFAIVNAGLVAVWLYVARGIVVQNRRLTEEKEAAEAKVDVKVEAA